MSPPTYTGNTPPGADGAGDKTILAVASESTGRLEAFGLSKKKAGWTSTPFWLSVLGLAGGMVLVHEGRESGSIIALTALGGYVTGNAIIKAKAREGA